MAQDNTQEEATRAFRRVGAAGGGGDDSGGGTEEAADPGGTVSDAASGVRDAVGGVVDAGREAAETVGDAVGSLTGGGSDDSGGGGDSRDRRRSQSPQPATGTQRAIDEDQQTDRRAPPSERQQRQRNALDRAGEVASGARQSTGRQQARVAQQRFLSGEIGQDASDISRGISDTVGRGSPASNTARDITAEVAATTFNDPEEALGAVGVNDLDVDARTRGGRNIAGPQLTNINPLAGPVLEEGDQGRINTDVTESLTEGRGLFATSGDDSGFFTETEQSLRETAEARRSYFGVGDELASVTPDVEIAGVGTENVARGAGGLPGEAAALPTSTLLAADTSVETAANTPRTVREYGAGETARTALDVGGAASGAVTQEIERNPGRFIGEVGGGIVGGLAAGRAIQRAPDMARSASIRARGGKIVDFDEVSDPPTRTEGIGLPGYTQRAQADPETAADEFLEQAKANDLAGDDPVAFHARAGDTVDEYGGFGRDFTAPEGSSELPGLFQSADLSQLRLSDQSGSGGLSIGLPRPGSTGSRILAERDIDVDVAEGQTTREVAESIADADRSKSYVRGGDVTPEQEVVAPPGSRFVDDSGVFGVRIGGRDIPFTDRKIGGNIATGRLARRADAGEAADDVADAATLDELADESTEALSETLRRSVDEPDNPFVPVGFGSGTSGRATGQSETRTVSVDETTAGTVPTDTGTGTSGSETGGTSTVPDYEPPTGGGGDSGAPNDGTSTVPDYDPPAFDDGSGGPGSGNPPTTSPPTSRRSPPGSTATPPGGPGTPSIPGAPSTSSPPERVNINTDDDDLEEDAKPPQFAGQDALFSSGFVSGEELLRLSLGEE